MTSDAGGGVSRRRRDFDLLLSFLGLLWLLSMLLFMFQFLEPSRNFTPSTVLEGKSNSWSRERWWCLVTTPPFCHLLVLSPPKPSPCCDALIKADSFSIAQLPFHRSRYAQAPPEASSHWVSLMARDSSLGPSDAPCLVESSTAHGEVFFWMVFPWLSDKFSTTKLVISIARNFGSSRSAPKSVQRLAPDYRTPAMANITDMAVLSRISFSGQPLASTEGRTTNDKTLITQMGLTNPSPLRFLSRPMYDLIGLAQLAPWPRSVSSNSLAIPNLLTSSAFDEIGQGLQSHFVVTLIVRNL
ncbi:unnamed protein product [Arabidopsis arenosa]|uniref:Uncharacterized protein n=1 Tax=Arabidopsis arenosa TaxID=38785 RepID=A0A8S2AFI0_ARAAE|nr:unnamed protein product [Arabidopsis arenosa]